MSSITEIAPDVYRISTYVPEIDLQFNQFLVRDDQPLLYPGGIGTLSTTIPTSPPALSPEP